MEEIKCEACRAFYLFFYNEFNKFIYTVARMSDSIYHIIFKISLKSYFGVKTLGFCHMCHFIMFPENLKTTSGLSILMHGVISLSDATSYDKKNFYLSASAPGVIFDDFLIIC